MYLGMEGIWSTKTHAIAWRLKSSSPMVHTTESQTNRETEIYLSKEGILLSS